MKNSRGYLITFEGPEGGGKTVQLMQTAERLRDRGLDVLCIKEPGGTEIGEELRKVLLDRAYAGIITTKTEALIFQASRAQICEEKILPFLVGGGVVLLDRFTDSTVAYQGHARGLGCGWVDKMNEWSTDGLIPDLTILLDIPVEKGIERKRRQLEFNRLDAEEREFHEKVREAYLTLARVDSININTRWEIIDASRGIGEVGKDILRVVESRLIQAGFIEGNYKGKELR